ncbi:ROK family protein [Alicyclobacillus tolerans]|uniref:ROK family protein n=1 Tax=Alicyclobacillus tolerans TaxID=90970 RepID=UPI003B7A0E44
MSEQVVLGVDVGGTNVKAAIVSVSGEVMAAVSYPTDAEDGPERFVQRLYEQFIKLLQKSGCQLTDVLSVGVGLAGFLDVEHGYIEEAVNLHWRNVAIVQLLSESLHLPIYLDNDANIAALGEAWQGAGQNAKSVLCVTLGTGVGGGIVLDGQIYRGVSTMAGEIGHITVKPGGPLCNCGRHGCLETLASATALVNMGVAHGLHSPSGGTANAEEIFALAKAGHRDAQQVIQELVNWLGVGLGIAANLLNPDKIVIAGGLVNAGDALMDPLRASFAANALQRVYRSCELLPATLGSRAGMLGAARLAIQGAALENSVL